MSAVSPSGRKPLAGKALPRATSIKTAGAQVASSSPALSPSSKPFEEQKEFSPPPSDLSSISSSSPDMSISIRDRFSSLQSRFSTFESDLLQQQRTSSQGEKEQIQRMATDITSLQSSLSIESSTRQSSLTDLSTLLTSSLATLEQRITEPLNASLSALNQRLDSLQLTVRELAEKVEQNQSAVPSIVQSKVEEQRLEERKEKEERLREVKERMEREQLIVNRLVGLEAEVKEERKQERRMWEERISKQNMEVEDEAKLRVKETEALKERLRVEVEELREGLAAERKEREETDKLISTMLQQYAITLQEGIKIVASK